MLESLWGVVALPEVDDEAAVLNEYVDYGQSVNRQRGAHECAARTWPAPVPDQCERSEYWRRFFRRYTRYTLESVPIQFDEYTGSDEFGNWLRPDSNSDVVLSFLAAHPEQGFTPTEIHENVDIPTGSIGPTLQRLEDRGFVRHKGSYWAIARDDCLAGLASTRSTLQSMDNLDDWEDIDWEAEAADRDEMEAWREARRE